MYAIRSYYGCIGIVVAELLHHPTRRVPAPGGVDDPPHRADTDGQDPEAGGLDALDDRAGDDGCGRVITSYSIHYTKLYESRLHARRDRGSAKPGIADHL